MASKFVFAAAGLAQLAAGAALPAVNTTMRVPLRINTPGQIFTNPEAVQADFNSMWVLADQNKCAGQSCVVADVAGVTGDLPKFNPQGGDAASYRCIAKYNPEGARAAQASPKVPKQDVGLSSILLGTMNSIGQWVPGFGPTDSGRYRGRCASNILIFAKGTTEVGELGITVGPALSLGLSGFSWSVNGVPYDATIAGDYCLGLPGGMVAKDMINDAAAKCPSSKIFVSGYSQGAMVARIGIAYANDDAKSKVKGLITFGDPMQGAKIRGYNGPISIYCNVGDYICTGNFELAASHLAYVGGPSTMAIMEFQKMARNS